MPYCPECGVEVDSNIKNCPLCDIVIPVLKVREQNRDYQKVNPLKFPEPENFNKGYFIDLKRKTFFAISSLFMINIFYLLGIQFLRLKIIPVLIFISLILLSLWIYLFCFFGFVKNRKLLLVIVILNSFLFTFLIDFFNKGPGWFIPVFVPSTILGSFIVMITAVIIRQKKKKSFSLLFYISIALSAFLIGIEGITSNYLNNKITFSWSIIMSLEIITFSLLLIFYYLKLPQRVISKLKKKLHI
jgi:hypothetical protein